LEKSDIFGGHDLTTKWTSLKSNIVKIVPSFSKHYRTRYQIGKNSIVSFKKKAKIGTPGKFETEDVSGSDDSSSKSAQFTN